MLDVLKWAYVLSALIGGLVVLFEREILSEQFAEMYDQQIRYLYSKYHPTGLPMFLQPGMVWSFKDTLFSILTYSNFVLLFLGVFVSS